MSRIFLKKKKALNVKSSFFFSTVIHPREYDALWDSRHHLHPFPDITSYVNLPISQIAGRSGRIARDIRTKDM